MTPGWRLFVATFGLLWLLKSWTLIRTGTRPSVVYLLLWPGMNPLAAASTAASRRIDPQAFLRGWARMFAGLGALLGVALLSERMPEAVVGWAGIGAMLLAIHFGFAEILPWLLRWCGYAAPKLFDRPWAARSLDEFWSHRWNLAFVEMNRLLFVGPLRRWFGRRHAVTATFVLSGLFHEAAISFPAGGGWGGPLAYFVLQGMLVHLRGVVRGRLRTMFCVLTPLPWLFHDAFRGTLVVPFYRWLGALLLEFDWLTLTVTAAGVGHFVVLLASVQVPGRLGWREDIAKLTRFNQKIFWVYGLFILFCVVGFGVLTLLFREDLVQRAHPLARALSAFIAAFWTIRILTDLFWYDHRDWPPGNAMVTGHALLTTLFCALAGTYWAVAILP
jgi:hypothetical protein